MRLELRDLSKTYPSGFTALSGINLKIDRGLFGLLGPNGAGKTTLMKIACTLLDPTSGSYTVDGRDVAEDRDVVRKRLGYLGQEWGAPKQARCGEVVDLQLRLRGVSNAKSRDEEVHRLLNVVGLLAVRNRRVKTLSGGMLRRLGVAQALAGGPELIVMDEPTVGLDPTERVEFRNLLTQLGRERTIVLSTHIVEDVGTTCERVAILAKGKLQFEGAPHELAAKAAGSVFEVLTPDDGKEQELRDTGVVIVSTTPTSAGPVHRVVGKPPASFQATAVEPRLEDAYLHLVPEASGTRGES